MKLIKNVIILLVMALPLWAWGQDLEDYQKIAAENNPGLQGRYKEFKAALEKVPQVSSLPDPTLSFGYFISPVETRVGPQQAKFSLSQMFPWFGTLEAQGNAAALMAQAKYQSFIDARNKLYYHVADAYYPLYELDEQLRLQRENLEILESFMTLAQSKYENNQSSMVDVLRVDIMIKDARTNIDILEDKRQPLLTRFNNQLNRDASETVSIVDTINVSPLPDGYRRDSLLINHPLLEELSLKEEAMKEQEKAAIRKGLPSFGLGLDYVLVGERTDMDLADNGQDALMPMVTVSLPIFRGKYKAAKEEARIMQEAYRDMRQEMANNLGSAYEMVWFEMEKQRQNLDLYREQIDETSQALNLLFTSYSNNGNDFEEVLRMQQQLLKYQMMKATSLSEYKIAEAKLNYITSKN
ncbi:MAG TPA: TolC family protein [Cryomorphaceae bacterium]|nr:transporter [Owenweeksia sp.]MBF99582.1 transporter [Owenweeksia sp.]HAD97284.1 TolC family protein [Cryomorphaceae bacterium]HBF21623.1 TolC family protein [Cryomorphaceae bacterium]